MRARWTAPSCSLKISLYPKIIGDSFAVIERFMDGDGGAQTAALPTEQVLRWVAGVVGGMRVLSVENPSRSTHRPSGTFRLRVEGTSTGATDLILKLSVPRWITDGMVITNARALRLAETYGLAAPRLIAADLDGSASGTVATLETFLSGSSDLPPIVSAARLREAGAAIARVNAVVLAPQADLPHRPRPCAVDDRAAERRRGWTPTTTLLQQADERVRSHGDADDDVGVPAWRRVGRQHAVGGRPLRRPHRLEDGRSW